MIGILDVTEEDQQTLLRVAAEYLVWFPITPAEWGSGWSSRRGMSVWVWMDPITEKPRTAASDGLIVSVYRLQRAGLLGPAEPFCQVMPTRAGARVINDLHGDGWQPPDRARIAISATTRKAVTRARKRRLA
jgi:hypothetical protein